LRESRQEAFSEKALVMHLQRHRAPAIASGNAAILPAALRRPMKVGGPAQASLRASASSSFGSTSSISARRSSCCVRGYSAADDPAQKLWLPPTYQRTTVRAEAVTYEGFNQASIKVRVANHEIEAHARLCTSQKSQLALALTEMQTPRCRLLVSAAAAPTPSTA
jgi:hypothetical protein